MSLAISHLWRFVADEDGTPTMLARVTGDDATGTAVDGEGYCVKQADLATIHHGVVEPATSTYTVATATLTISAVVYDSLQTDALWDVDSTGYNFRHRLSAAALPDGGRIYRAVYKFTTTGGGVGFFQVELPTLETWIG